MIPEFMRFYSYTLIDVLNENARTFFALINSMLEITAREMLNSITVHRGAISEDNKVVEELQKRQQGLSKIINEVKTANNARGKK